MERDMIAEEKRLALKVWGGRHLTTEEIDTFLTDTKIARFCCLNDDGTIHATPVWFMYKNRQFIIITPNQSRKSGNVKRNNSVTILVDTEEPPRGVIIYGTAKPETAFELEQTVISICEKYMPKDKAREQWRSVCPPKTNWLKITVTPTHMVSFTY
jgi:nitroimidazol reductase NimA-like FMN-containing flavoprotein (pyridoxamine 5'-phosphate oxidase superfamily)